LISNLPAKQDSYFENKIKKKDAYLAKLEDDTPTGEEEQSLSLRITVAPPPP